ncbi:MAG: radical SAM protein [Candidatus Omnitrophota bacterium]
MKITLVLPAVGKKSGAGYIRSWKMQPLTMAVLAGLTPAEHEVELYDDRLEDIPFDISTDLVALSIETYTARRSYEIAREFRKRGIKVIAGGFHATLVPDEVKEHVDAVTIGEAEGVWQKMLVDAKAGKLQKRYQSSQRPDLTGIKPCREIFRNKHYLPLSLVEFGRGCRHSCQFCSICAFYKKTYTHRPVADVVAEISSLKDKSLFFVDDNIMADPKAARELFIALKPLKRRWISQCSLHAAQDEEMLRLMKESGCYGLLIGFESLNPGNLSQMGKTVSPVHAQWAPLLGNIRRAGIKIYATFIFGYDNDDAATIKETLNFALEQKFFLAAFNHLVPFPGTPLYQQFLDEGRMIHPKWWQDANYHYGEFSFAPERMPPGEFAKACVQARKDFYSLSSILWRATDFRANSRGRDILDHFALNLMLQREVEQKFGFGLGKE